MNFEPVPPSSAPESSDALEHHDTDTNAINATLQPTPPTLEPPLALPLPPALDYSASEHAEHPEETQTEDPASRARYSHASMTVEGDVGSTTMLDRTLVEGDEREGSAKNHTKVSSSSSFSSHSQVHAAKKSLSASAHSHHRNASTEGLGNGTTPVAWDPLNTLDSRPEARDESQTLENTVFLEEGDVVDSKGKLLFPHDLEVKVSPAPSKRGSHLRLDLKPTSPQPWEQIDPPLDNNLKAIAGYYSPAAASQKFHSMQNSAAPRPLIPKSSYYFGPPPPDSAYGTAPTGHIGVHHPREILRVERDYTGGELIQFAPIYPLELEGRITPTQFLESINEINEMLISAHSLRHSLLDNMLAIFSLQISKLFLRSHFEKEMQRLHDLIDQLNAGTFNPVGLNILWPRNVAFLYLEIEYY